MGLRDITIRKFRTEDAKAVAKIITDNLFEANDNENNVEFTPKFVLTLSNKRKMYVAIEENVIIGTASIDFDTILAVYVDIQHRNKGVEEALISFLEEIAANNGFKLIKIEASIDAEKLYKNFGFSVTEKVSSNELGKFINMEKYLF